MDYIKIAKERGIAYALYKCELDILKATMQDTVTAQAELLKASKQSIHWKLLKYKMISKRTTYTRKETVYRRAVK